MHIVNHLIESFHEGGWPMFPILIIGILQILTAVRYATHPDARQLLLVRSLVLLTLGLGVFGTVAGIIHSCSGIYEVPVEQAVKLFLMGFGESLNNLSLALVLNVFAGLLTAVGALRATERLPANSK